nr:hypothetical protein [Bacillota bacterium]
MALTSVPKPKLAHDPVSRGWRCLPASRCEEHLARALRKQGIVVVTNKRLGDRGFEVDILIEAAKVVVEVDGPFHCLRETRRRDEEKTRWLESEGYLVLRVSTEEIRYHLKSVLQMLLPQISKRTKALRGNCTTAKWSHHPLLRAALEEARLRMTA